MKTLFIAAFLFIHSCTNNQPFQEPNVISMVDSDFVVGEGDTLIINTADLIGLTITFVEYEDKTGCETNCDIDKITRKIEYDQYKFIYDPNRYHAVLIDGQIKECLIRTPLQ